MTIYCVVDMRDNDRVMRMFSSLAAAYRLMDKMNEEEEDVSAYMVSSRWLFSGDNE
jgi:hypothetical protein